MMDIARKMLMRQILDAAVNVLYTYSAHWVIVNRLKCIQTVIKITQICLLALTTGGFLTSVITDIPWLNWVGGIASAVALGLHLYSLNFNLPSDIKNHTDAANELWDVREAYKALITDYHELTNEEIRAKRDYVTRVVSKINKEYPGTDSKAFAKAQKNMKNYMFELGESARVLNVEIEDNIEKSR